MRGQLSLSHKDVQDDGTFLRFRKDDKTKKEEKGNLKKEEFFEFWRAFLETEIRRGAHNAKTFTLFREVLLVLLDHGLLAASEFVALKQAAHDDGREDLHARGYEQMR